MREHRLALIVDELSIARFQLEGLKLLKLAPLDVFSCTNTNVRRDLVKHFLYYLLKLLVWRTPEERRIALPATGLPLGRSWSFQSLQDGSWQSLPPHVVRQLCSGRYDAILKFGMNLMRVPAELSDRILSYHHGDPDTYRGRPAGLYELLNGEPAMGQVIQILSNKLDAGRVVAFAETKVHNHSYRTTLRESLRHSPLLLPIALRNLATGRVIPRRSTGKNFRLPSNWLVLNVITRTAAAKLRRLAYGAFIEKGWNVSLVELKEGERESILAGGDFPAAGRWRTIEKLREFNFYADPFFLQEDQERILVEAMDRSTGKGKILFIEHGSQMLVSRGRGHFSYPATIREGDRTFVVPEIAGWAAPSLFELREKELHEAWPLQIEGSPRIIDPTIVSHGGRFYLFGNRRDLGDGVLWLWWAESLARPFAVHTASPVRISPYGSRMGGAFVQVAGQLVRFGQDSSGAYGDGILAFAVRQLSPDRYEEEPMARLSLGDVHGPHTINFAGNFLLFDWYRNRFSPAAGMRRLLGKLT